MPVTVTSIRSARLLPEIHPDTQFQDIAANTAVSPDPLDIRRFGLNRIIQLRDLAADRNANVQGTFRSDGLSEVFGFGAVRDLVAMDYRLTATQNLTYRLENTSGSTINNYRTHFGVWIDELRPVHKLWLGLSLNPQEREVVDRLGANVREQVQQGLLPLTFETLVSREYQPISELQTSHRVSSIDTTAGNLFAQFSVNQGEALILTAIGADPGLPGDNIEITIDRDDQNELVTFQPFAVGGLDNEIGMWIPATEELRFTVNANNAVSDWDVRLTLRRVRLTQILRARWGLMTRDENPDLFDRVFVGIV